MPIETIKISELPILSGADLVPTDRVVILDRSATTGPGSGPEGTVKTMESSRLADFTTVKGVVHDLNLVGINTAQPLFSWVASAINTYGPYAGNPGEDLYFRTYQVSGPQNNYAVTIMYFKLLSGRLLAGGAGNTIAPSELVLSGGPWVINAEVNADLFLEIGDAGVGPIHTYFNLGEDHVVDGDPWVIAGQIFLTGILNGQPTIWQFLAGDGNWGGDSGNNTGPADFINLSLQPPAIGFALTKIHYLSLFGIDTTVPELTYIAAAVKAKGPFTCAPGQQMVFKTQTYSGSTGTGGVPTGGGIVTRYYRLIPNYTSVGGPYPQPVPASWFMPDGDGIFTALDDGTVFVELEDIDAGPVEDYFNLGNETSPGVFEAWDMNIKRFVRATLDGDVIIWAFKGVEGLYGGDDMGTDPNVLEAVADDFFNITQEPVTPSTVVIMPYEDIGAMLSHQSEQTNQNLIFVENASADTNITFAPGETKKHATYIFQGPATGNISDYKLQAAPYGNHVPAGIIDIYPNINPQVVFDATDAGSLIRFLPGLHEWGINNNSRTENAILYVHKPMSIELMAGATLRLADGTVTLSTEPEIIKNQGVVGLDDFAMGDTSNYTGGVKRDYYVIIDGTGSPNTFKWGYFNEDNTYTLKASGVSITGSEQTLDDGVKIKFTNLTGHTFNSAYFICYDGSSQFGIRVGKGFHTDYIEDVKIFGEGTIDLNRDNNVQTSLLAIETASCVYVHGRVRNCDILDIKMINSHRTVMAYGDHNGTYGIGGTVIGGESFDIEHLNILRTTNINLAVGDGCVELGHPEHRGVMKYVRCNDNYIKSLNTPIECNYCLREYEVLNNKIEGWSNGGYAIHCWRRSDNGLIMGNVLMNDPTGTKGMVQINAPVGWESAQNIRQFNNYNLNNGKNEPYPPLDGSADDPLANMIAYYPLATDSVEDLGITSGIDGVDTAMTYGSGEAQFNGTTSKIVVPDNDIFDFTDGNDTPWTVTFKLKLTNNNSAMPINKHNGTTGWYVYFEAGATGAVSIVLQSSSGNTIAKRLTSYSRTTGTYINVAVTNNGSETAAGLKLYINGSVVGLDTSVGSYLGLVGNATGLTFGTAGWTAAHFLTGAMKDIRFYDQEKSAIGIAAINAL
ncbi:hypothetical protein [Terasakiella sp.]|uniref:hypothetical protein n=1 Tax=Terasakiella sp. TaxID=2034861 RepID=UPI003AA87273